MFRLGRVGEVRGTMTGRVEPVYGLERPTPTRGVTGCRTRGEEELRVLGRDDELRAVGREDELRVVGRLRPLGGSAPRLDDDRPPLRLNGTVLGSTKVRELLPVVPPAPPPEEVLPGR